MNTEAVYTLLVEANPVPDPADETMRPVLERLRPTPVRSETMQLTTPRPVDSASPTPRRSRLIAAAAATTIAIVAIGAVVLTRDDTEPAEPASPPPTDATDRLPPVVSHEVAIDTARVYLDAFSRGDVDTALAMTDDGVPSLEAERNIVEMWAVLDRILEPAATYEACSASDALGWIEVRCDATVNDPVAIELGVDQGVWPIRVNDDLTVRWLPIEGVEFSQSNWAYSDYLRAYHPTEYEVACQPGAYEVGTIHANANLALTGACAELFVPLADDVVQWIRDGRPEPSG